MHRGLSGPRKGTEGSGPYKMREQSSEMRRSPKQRSGGSKMHEHGSGAHKRMHEHRKNLSRQRRSCPKACSAGAIRANLWDHMVWFPWTA